MALIKCPECGREISDKAKKCIHCGYKLNRKKQIKKIIGIVGAVAIFFGGFATGYGIRSIVSVPATTAEKVEDNDKDDGNKQINEDIKNATSIRIGEVMTKYDECQFWITGYDIQKTIEPDNHKGEYTYFKANDGNVYLDVRIKAQNMSKESVAQDKLFNYIKIVYDEKKIYNCKPIVEVGNAINFSEETSKNDIDPFEELNYHMLVQLPEAVKNNNKRLEVLIQVGDTTYKCALRSGKAAERVKPAE